MRQISPSQLRELATQFNVELNEKESYSVCKRVNELVCSIDEVLEMPLQDGFDLGDRSWWQPDQDPHNAITTACFVPPADGHNSLLDGRKVGVKDILAVGGVPMECASQVMQGYIPARDVTVVQRIREAGGTITAKTNLDEFAASPWSQSNSGVITNPHDKGRIAGK